MEIKRFFKTYTVFPPTLTSDSTISHYVRSLTLQGKSSKEFTKCFCCGKKFEDDYHPKSAWVQFVGGRFFCPECAAKIDAEFAHKLEEKPDDANNDEGFELDQPVFNHSVNNTYLKL